VRTHDSAHISVATTIVATYHSDQNEETAHVHRNAIPQGVSGS